MNRGIRPWRCLIAVGCLALVACSRPGEEPDRARADTIDRVMGNLRTEIAVIGRPAPPTYELDARMAEHEVPGVSVAVVEGGRIAWARGFGVRQAGTADSVSTATLFQAASISKPIAATALLRMVDDGLLDLDVPVNDYLTSWTLPKNAFTDEVPVTLRHLLSHGAGTTVWGFPGYQVGADLPTVPQILDGLPPANTPAVRVERTPGKAWLYSGGGVTVAQLVATDVARAPYAEVVNRLVLQPFGMERSTFAQPLPQEWAGEAAAGHRDGSTLAGRWHVYPELAAAGLWTTPSDLLSWAIHVANAFHGGPGALLSQELTIGMLTPQQGNTGLGPGVGGAGEGFFFGHGGANAGFRAQLVYFPETGQGAAVMSNGDGGGPLNREILLALGAEYAWPDYAAVAPLELDADELDDYRGRFVAEQPPVTLTMRREDGALFVQGEGALGRQEVVFLAADRAITLGTGTEIVFRRSADGSVASVESMGLVLRPALAMNDNGVNR